MSLLATFLARWLGQKAGKLLAELLPFLLIGAAVIGGVLYVRGLQKTVAKQKTEITSVKQDLTTEKAARQRDVAGLTTLAKGQANVAAQSKVDQQILTETVNASPPQAASPALSALIAGLRAADDKQHAATAH